jgi:hypothetical protein
LHEGLGYAKPNGTLSLSRIFLGTPRFLKRSTVGIESFAALSISPPRSPLHDLHLRKLIAASSQNDAIALQKNKTIASHPPQQKAIAHFSKTNPIAFLITHNTIASHPPQQKAIAHFSKTNPIALQTNHSTIASLLPQEKGTVRLKSEVIKASRCKDI